MAAKKPFWEICSKDVTPRVGSAGYTVGVTKTRTDWWARLKGRNGRIVVTTETYQSKKGATNAIAVVDPDSNFEVKDKVVVVEEENTSNGAPS